MQGYKDIKTYTDICATLGNLIHPYNTLSFTEVSVTLGNMTHPYKGPSFPIAEIMMTLLAVSSQT